MIMEVPVDCSFEAVEVTEEGWMTPRHDGCMIPVRVTPPPPPKKKRWEPTDGATKTVLPFKEGYFNPPELELFFKMSSRTSACAST